MHLPGSPPAAGNTKRRKLRAEADVEKSADAACAAPAADESRGWSLELCPGSDETLQIGRLSAGRDSHGRPGQGAGDSSLDSYRLETLAVAERTLLDANDRETLEDSMRWCDAVVSAQHVAISIDCRIHILSADCQTQVAVVCHSSRVLATALSRDSSFVAYGDDAGTLFIVHIETRQPVFSQSIRSPDSPAGPAAGIRALHFALSDSAPGQPKEELVVVGGDGHAVRFSGIQLSLLSQAILDGDMALAAGIRSEILVESVALEAAKRPVHQGGITGLAVFHARGHSLMFASGHGDACLSCWQRAEPGGAADHGTPTSLADIVTSECAGSGYSKILLSLDQRYVIALSAHGWIDVYERSTLTLVFRHAEAAFDDFGLLAPPATSSAARAPAAMLIVAISKPLRAGGDVDVDDGSECESDGGGVSDELRRRLVVLSLPSMEVVYTMDTSPWSWLVQEARTALDVADTILFVEGLVVDGVQKIYLRSLCETVPLDRLAHFLRAGRYEEAHAFADSHGIPTSLVHRRRLEELLSNPEHATLAGLRDEESVARFVDATLELLGHIDDAEFSVRVCTDLAVPSFDGTRRLLAHARALASDDVRSLARVDCTIQRLGTWSAVCGDDSREATAPCFDRRGWAVFRSADLASCARSYIARGDIPRASALWRRHRDDPRLKADISGAIQGFPSDVDAKALAGWLRVEVLPALETCEQWQDVAGWVEQRARMLESSKQLAGALCLVELLNPGFWRAGREGYDPYKHASGGLAEATPRSALDTALAVCGPLAFTPQRFIDGTLRAAQWTAGLTRFGGHAEFTTAPDTAGASGTGDAAAQSCLFLHRQLLDLMYLREKHDMVLTLDEYDQLSYSMIAVEFLDRVAAPELLPAAYFDHFLPYAQRHNLDHALILREYCVELMDAADREGAEHAGDTHDGGDDAMSLDVGVRTVQSHHSWEPRVLQLLACLYMGVVSRNDPSSGSSGLALLSASARDAVIPPLPLTASRASLLKTLFDVALDVMRRSAIPWPPSIDAAIDRTLALLDRYADADADIAHCKLEIGEQHRLMCLKRMLLSHGLPDFRISNTKMAYPLLQWLVRKTEGGDILPDVLQLVDAYHHLSRTSAYVLRLQALCEAGLVDQAGDLIAFVDATEHSSAALRAAPSRQSSDALAADESSAMPAANGSGDGQLISKYVPLEVARRGVCWIREVLDGMSFGGDASRSQFKRLVGTAMAVLRSLKGLALRYEERAREGDGIALRHLAERHLSRPQLGRLQAFVAAETSALGVVWQLLVDGGIMVSPGELEQQSTREQILGEILDQQWLRAYVSHPGAGARKGKGVAVAAGADMERGPPQGVLGLPLLPANVRALATMLRFSSSQLSLRIVAQCLALRLYMMALDMCQQMAETLNAAGGRSAAPEAARPGYFAADEWAAVAHAVAMCERNIGQYLGELTPDGSTDSGPAPPSKPHGLPGEYHGLLARRLVAVCQASSLKCVAHPHLVTFLDACARWELARSIFDQTTDGDFAALTRRVPALPAPARAQAYGTSWSVPAMASGSSAGATREADDGLPVSEPDGSQTGLPDGWLGPLYTNQYAERGLVLGTGRAMWLVYRLVSALRRLAAGTNDGSFEGADCSRGGADQGEVVMGDSSAKDKARPAFAAGKAAALPPSGAAGNEAFLDTLGQEETRTETIQRCHELVALLTRNRHWALAVQAIQLTVSQLARSSFVVPGDVQSDGAGESLALLRRRLSLGGMGEDELAMLFGTGDAATATEISDLTAKSLVRSLQQQQGIDSVFIFSCMLLVPPVKAYQHLSTAMSHSGLHPSRVISLANIGSACSLVWKQQALLDRCRSVAAAARWSAQLQMLHLKFDVALLSDPKPELLEPLVRPMLLRTNMDITALLEFAEAFRLDEAFVVLEYISLCCSVSHVDSYQARVLGIADEIPNTKLLERTYIDVLENRISSYDYERLHFVVQRLQELRPQDKAAAKYATVLDILSSYDRKSAPSHNELRQEWTRTRAARDSVRQMSADAPTAAGPGAAGSEATAAGDDAAGSMSYAGLLSEYPLASRRLPFHGMAGPNPWATLLAELSVDTVDMLLPLAQPLELSEDDFYMNLIDGILGQWKSGDAAGDSGASAAAAYELAVSKVPARFNSIQQLIRCFKDPEAVISTIKHVADEFPCGPDRIAALKMGIKMLCKWDQYTKRTAEPERGQMLAKTDAIHQHFERSYTDAMTEIALRRNGMEAYLALFADAQSAEATVHALTLLFEGEFAKPSRVAAAAARDGDEPLYEVLRRLAAVYDIGLGALMQTLLQRYLETPAELAEGTSELQLPSTRYQASLRHPRSSEAALRRRIIYILHTHQASEAVELLLAFAYSSKGGISCLCRARALEILFAVATHDDIAQVQQPSNVHRYFQALLYLADFEYVGIPQSTADFLDCDKAALARSIWVEHHQNPRAAQLICNMCLDFGVEDGDLLLRMLPRLVEAKMFWYLIGVLETVSNMRCYAAMEELAVFWNQALAERLLQIARAGPSSGWIEGGLSALGACVRSRYLPTTGVAGIVRALTHDAATSGPESVGLPLACAVLDVLPYCRSAAEAMSSCVGGLEPESISMLVRRLLELDDAATAVASSQVFVDWKSSRSLTMIFDLLDERGIHEQVLLCPPQGKIASAFVQNRILHDRLLSVVNTCIASDKRLLASLLVSQYYSVRPAGVLIEDARRAGVSLDGTVSTGADEGGYATGDFDAAARLADADTPTGTQDVSRVARKRAARIPDSQRLDIYLRSHE